MIPLPDLKEELQRGVPLGNGATFDEGRGSVRIGAADSNGARPVIVVLVERVGSDIKTYAASSSNGGADVSRSGKACFGAEAGLMHEGEFERLKAEFQALRVRDEPNRTRLTNELENVVRLVLDKVTAERFVKQIKDVSYYPMIAFSGGPDMTPETWLKGRARMVGLIESIEHNIRLSAGSRPSARKKNMDRVFIVHGHDHPMLHEIEAFVRRIGIQPVILMEEASRGGTVIEKFERNADVPFAIVLLSPDDIGRAASAKPGTEKRRPRQNAVLEAGFFIGRLGRQNVTIVVDAEHDTDAEYPSDLAGVVTIHYAPGGDWKTRLMRELKASDIEHDASKA
jgi:predicted nucleotide-binding protein